MICGPGLCGGCGRSGGDVATGQDWDYEYIWVFMSPLKPFRVPFKVDRDERPRSCGYQPGDAGDFASVSAEAWARLRPSARRPEQPAPIDRPAWAAEMDRKLDELLASRPQWEGE